MNLKSMNLPLTLLTTLLLAPLATLHAAEYNVLHDGTEFRSWERPRRHTRTDHTQLSPP